MLRFGVNPFGRFSVNWVALKVDSYIQKKSDRSFLKSTMVAVVQELPKGLEWKQGELRMSDRTYRRLRPVLRFVGPSSFTTQFFVSFRHATFSVDLDESIPYLTIHVKSL